MPNLKLDSSVVIGLIGTLIGVILGILGSLYLQEIDIEFRRSQLTYNLRLETYSRYDLLARELVMESAPDSIDQAKHDELNDLYSRITLLAGSEVFQAADYLLTVVEDILNDDKTYSSLDSKYWGSTRYDFVLAVKEELGIPR